MSKKTFKIVFDPINGNVVADGRILEWIESIPEHLEEVTIGNEPMLHELRAQHMEEKIHITHIIFKDPVLKQETWINVNEDGRIDYWPKGFADTTEHALYRLMQGNERMNAERERRKEEREKRLAEFRKKRAEKEKEKDV